MSGSIMLSDIFKRNGIDVNNTLLIRHPWKDVKEYYEKGTVIEYTRWQEFKSQKKLWVVFTGEEFGSSARFYTCYENKGYHADGKGFEYDLIESDILLELRGRLVIDWGKNNIRSWYQSADREKTILSIHAKLVKQFPGYENVKNLTYPELKEIVENKEQYKDWHIALKNIKAIYLITNPKTGKMYVGSASGKGGLLNRWADYVFSGTGGNQGIEESLEASPDEYKDFRFSILQVISPVITESMVVDIENSYKEMLLSRIYGMNKN